MEILNNILQLIAGIGLFLFAMYLLEESLKQLSGRKFKRFLQRATQNRVGAVAGGAIVTAILQSSSMVSMMVLAFVGAGVFSMRNAMAVILGANLGTTLDSWVVATIGFKMNIAVIAYPAVAIAGFLLILFGRRPSIKYLSYFLFGFGLLFIGLSYMKTAMEVQVQAFDFAPYVGMHLAVFLLIGFLTTTIVQSSSATMALTLSALHSGAIGFAPAAAIVLGSEAGTTIKLLLSAIGGNTTKKRVALGNFLFNLSMVILTFFCLSPLLTLITEVIGITDPLIGLVTFSTIINLVGVLVFLPFLDPYARLLEKFFKGDDQSVSVFITQADVAEPETAIDLFRKEIELFIFNAMRFNLQQFDVRLDHGALPTEILPITDQRRWNAMSADEQYIFLKHCQGELQAFYLGLRAELSAGKNVEQLAQLIGAARSTMYAVKSIKDIRLDIANLIRSSHEVKFEFFKHQQEEFRTLYLQLAGLMQSPETADLTVLQAVYQTVEQNYTSALNDFYQNALTMQLPDLDITSVINFNRELFTANKAMVMAVKDMVLDEEQAEELRELIGYRT